MLLAGQLAGEHRRAPGPESARDDQLLLAAHLAGEHWPAAGQSLTNLDLRENQLSGEVSISGMSPVMSQVTLRLFFFCRAYP